MKLAIKFAGLFSPLLLLLVLESGCTYALWTNGSLVACKEPAENPDLHLFQSSQRSDFLVVYNERSERTDAIHRRAYWLNQNQCRLEKQKSPVFDRNHARHFHLTEIPVFYSMPKIGSCTGIYAVCDTNQDIFVLFSGNHEIGSYDFPVYNDHWGNVERVALTPLALTADVSVAGGIAAVLVAYGMGQSGYTVQVGK